MTQRGMTKSYGAQLGSGVGFGILGTAAWYGGVYLLKDVVPLFPFFFERGPIQPIATLLFLTALGLLLGRARSARGEKAGLDRLQALVRDDATSPVEIVRMLDRQSHGRTSRMRDRLSGLLQVVSAGEDPFGAHARLSQCHREALDGAHAIPRWMVGAIPMLGLLGTLVGLSQAMAVIPRLGRTAQTLEETKSVLLTFGAGLDTAFDTTILGLVLALLLTPLLYLTRQREEELLQAIDGFIEDYVLPRLPRANPVLQICDAAEAIMAESLERLDAALQAAQANVIRQFEEGAKLMATRGLEGHAEAVRRIVEAIAQREEKLLRDLTHAMGTAIQPTAQHILRSAAELLRDRDGDLVRELRRAVTDGIQAPMERLAQSNGRPRIYRLIEEHAEGGTDAGHRA